MIRIKNTRTGRTVKAKNGADAALMLKIEQDRRTGLEVAEANRVHRQEVETARLFAAHDERERQRDAECMAAMDARAAS
jgi:hypothetical protein